MPRSCAFVRISSTVRTVNGKKRKRQSVSDLKKKMLREDHLLLKLPKKNGQPNLKRRD
jgi:hypothetical protein